MKEESDFLVDITIKDEEYIINAFDNKKRPKNKQMSVVLQQFSGQDLGEIARKTAYDIKDNLMKEFPKLEGEKYQERFAQLYDMAVKKWQFVYRIKKLKNFKFKLGEKTKTFVDPEKLYDYKQENIALIVQELALHFDGLDNLDLKNL